MIRQKFLSKKAEGYIDVCITVVIFVMLTVIALNIFSFITLKAEMDQIADNLIIAATHSGRFSEEFYAAYTDASENYFSFSIDRSADKYYTSGDKVQLGDKMWVEVYKYTTIKGLGIFEIPIEVRVRRSGLSEVYWK